MIAGEDHGSNLFGWVVERSLVEYDTLPEYPNDGISDNGPPQNEGVAPVRGLAPIRPVIFGLPAKMVLMTIAS